MGAAHRASRAVQNKQVTLTLRFDRKKLKRRLVAAALATVLIVPGVLLAVPNTFSTGGTIFANAMNANFTFLEDAITANTTAISNINQSDPFIGEIRMFGGTFAPRNWAFCEGQLLPISQNTALFSLLGTTYGGDGRTTFALPDLRGRAPIHHGQGAGLSNYTLGQRSGQETVTLTTNQLPSHNHSITASLDATISAGNVADADGNIMAPNGTTRFSDGTTDASMPITASSALTGGGQPVSVRGPYLAVSYIIALQGTYPSRN